MNNSSIEYEISGSGKPVFVLLSGYDMPLDSWNKIRLEIGEYGTVFTYNRFGVGGSDKAIEKQCGKTIISDLRELLKILGVVPPYVLIGHSIGGMYVSLYGCLYPNEVSAAILIDPTHPDHKARFNDCKPPLHVRAWNGLLDILESFYSKSNYSELNSFGETADQIKFSGKFPDIPVSVIAGNKKMPLEPDRLRELHLNNQQEFSAISSKGKLIIAERSGHFPQVTEPELVSKVVIQLISEMADNNHG